MVSETTKFTAASRHDILRLINFPDFIYSCNRSYKINKTIMLATKINSIGSSTKVMDLKILSEPRNSLNMLQKNYQPLLLPYKLLMH